MFTVLFYHFLLLLKVDIFFRRALFQKEGDENERIFCLMNADKLQYDASEQSLKDVTEYIKSANRGMFLLIFLTVSIIQTMLGHVFL